MQDLNKNTLAAKSNKVNDLAEMMENGWPITGGEAKLIATLLRNYAVMVEEKRATIEMATKCDDLINALFALTEHRRGKESQA